jgi:hypothetical protein
MTKPASPTAEQTVTVTCACLVASRDDHIIAAWPTVHPPAPLVPRSDCPDRTPASCLSAGLGLDSTIAETIPSTPRCGIVQAMNDQQGIEIDYCPQCSGVWLDRGELDKVIGRSEVAEAPSVTQPTSGSPAGGWTQPAALPPQQPWSGGQHGPHQRHGGKRRKS